MSPNEAKGFFKKIANKATGVSLFVKVMGIALSLITLFGAGTIIKTRALLRDSVTQETEKRGRLLVRQLENSLIDPLVTGNLVAVSGLLTEAAEIHPDVKYIFILDRKKRVLVSTLEYPLSRELLETNAAGSAGEVLIEAEGETINDIAAPLLDGRLGTLRIGISQGLIRQAVNAITIRLLLSVFLAAVIGMGISYLLAFFLSKPITELIKGVELVEKGDFNISVRPWFDDEIGRLTAAFNNMAGALRREKAIRTELVRKLITGQEEERHRISRELHDRTGQSLTSIKLGLKVLETQPLPQEARTRLDEFRALLNVSLDELHELAVELRPPALGDLGLPRIVEELGDKFKTAFGIEVECAIDGYFRANRLAPAVEIGLYRIIQEAFSNIEKHSGASVVVVGFRKTAEEFRISVKDNGRGFDPGQVQGRAGRKPIGLYGMKERSEILGGKFGLSSRAGSGTEITVSLPAI